MSKTYISHDSSASTNLHVILVRNAFNPTPQQTPMPRQINLPFDPQKIEKKKPKFNYLFQYHLFVYVSVFLFLFRLFPFFLAIDTTIYMTTLSPHCFTFVQQYLVT